MLLQQCTSHILPPVSSSLSHTYARCLEGFLLRLLFSSLLLSVHISPSWKLPRASPSNLPINGVRKGGREERKGGRELSAQNHFFRVDVKVFTVAHKALRDLDSRTLSDLLLSCSTWLALSYTVVSLLGRARSRSLCLRVFSVAVLSAWNTLPTVIYRPVFLPSLEVLLKLHHMGCSPAGGPIYCSPRPGLLIFLILFTLVFFQ